MQLVGATQGFIRRPFLWRGVGNGIYASIVALLMLFGVVSLLKSQLPDISNYNDVNTYFILAGTVVFLGIFISWTSTYFALRRYLRLRADDLYF